EELQPFPMQMGRSYGDGALHLASDPDDPGIDPAKECYPAGQGVGAIDELVPAAELVARLIQEAARARARVDGPRAPVGAGRPRSAGPPNGEPGRHRRRAASGRPDDIGTIASWAVPAHASPGWGQAARRTAAPDERTGPRARSRSST